MQLARIDAPDADWLGARAHLSDLARGAVELATARTIGPDDLLGQTRALGALLTDRYGYAGDTESYDDPANANLIRVIERRRGLPVALGILWLHTARAAGWAGVGLDFPGHFLIALDGVQSQVVIDVFAGGVTLDMRDLRHLLKRVEGPGAALRPGLLAPMTARGVLLRLQNNILLRRLQKGDVDGALDCAENMLRFAPDEAALWRDTAMLHQRLDHVAAALRCFERFLALVPAGEAAARARTAMDQLRARLN